MMADKRQIIKYLNDTNEQRLSFKPNYFMLSLSSVLLVTSDDLKLLDFLS